MSEVRRYGRAEMVGRDVFGDGQAAQKMQRKMLGVFGLLLILSTERRLPRGEVFFIGTEKRFDFFLAIFPSVTYAPAIVPTPLTLKICLTSAVPITFSSNTGSNIPFIAASTSSIA